MILLELQVNQTDTSYLGRINYEKSLVYFPLNCNWEEAKMMSRAVGIPMAERL